MGQQNSVLLYPLDLFCRKQGKRIEVPSVQAFMALNQDPDLRTFCKICLATNQANKPPLKILEDDCLNRPPPPNKSGEESPASSNKEDIGSVTIPPPYKPQDPSAPAGHTRSGIPCLPPKSGLYPLRKVANGDSGCYSNPYPILHGRLGSDKTIRTIF